MRRKSERAAAKKSMPSPEKKLEKPKRPRTRRRKQSASSEESAEGSPVREEQVEVQAETVPPPSAPVKEDSPEEAQDQVWQVKTADGVKDTGEIQKLKICLTRPPSTPERPDRSPRSKRKHSHATSSSDTPSAESVDDRKKSRGRRHRRRSNRESKDDSDMNQDSQPEVESETVESQLKSESVVSQSTDVQQKETPVSTTNEEDKAEKSELGAAKETDKSEATSDTPSGKVPQPKTKQTPDKESQKSSDADTTVESPKAKEPIVSTKKDDPARQRSQSVEKSEVLELHVDEKTAESVDEDMEKLFAGEKDDTPISKEVSIEDKSKRIAQEVKVRNKKATNETDVVEYNVRRDRIMSTDSDKDADGDQIMKDLQHSTKSKDEPIHNGQPPPPLVISRRRKWGSRKLSTQKSITISTDVLKEIIPDVKPVEFNEVIEEKKHKRIEVADKVTRPVLPKIIIDNSENVKHKPDYEDKLEVKMEPLSANRKISIVKENDSIISRPLSPPRHKSSNILYITNLVRPFTLPQLKNLLQRTGRIVENGFWIDKIKSKCFVQYETEDQAVETRHALHGVTWPISNPKALQVDFSTLEAFDKARQNEDIDNAQASTIPGTVEDWMRELDEKRERGELLEKPWERKVAAREWDVGKGTEQDIERDKTRRDERPGFDKRRHRMEDRSPEPARKFKKEYKKEEEAPAKLLDDLFRKTKTTPCIYWLPLSAETIAIKEEQRRQHMAEHERRLQELRRPAHRRH